MILQKGAAAIVKEAIEIAGRSNPDAVFGELFTRRDWIGNLATCEPSDFRANVTATPSSEYTIPLILVTTVLAQPREVSNFAVRLNSGLKAAELSAATIQSTEETPQTEDSGNLIYAGYPCDPYK